MAKRSRAPDPDRLVRSSPGSYSTEDGRFEVRSAGGAGRWYLTDSERQDQLGLAIVLGPFASLELVREAIRAQRSAPAGRRGPVQAPGTVPVVEAAPVARARMAPEAPAPDTPTASRPIPPPPPQSRPARPRVRVGRARWRARGDERDAVAATLRRINDAWTVRDPAEMAHELHDRVAFVQPGFASRLDGRDAAIEGYREFLGSAILHSYTEHDLAIDVVGDTAVAVYRYEIDWEQDGVRHLETGHDLFVFTRADDAWQAAWRTVVPGPALDGSPGPPRARPARSS
jgi:hypothetical protein